MQISGSDNSVNFKGITPIRVYQNGVEVLDDRVIRNTCSKIIKAFSGPLEPKFKPAAAQLSMGDRDYSYIRAMRGYPDKFEKADAVPSDYIKAIYDRANRGYLVTGALSDNISAIGYRIGVATKDAKSRGLRITQMLEDARTEYSNFIKHIGNDLRNRTTEAYDRITGERLGNPVQIIAEITTKQVKVKGKPTQQVTLDNLYLYSKKANK